MGGECVELPDSVRDGGGNQSDGGRERWKYNAREYKCIKKSSVERCYIEAIIY